MNTSDRGCEDSWHLRLRSAIETVVARRYPYLGTDVSPTSSSSIVVSCRRPRGKNWEPRVCRCHDEQRRIASIILYTIHSRSRLCPHVPVGSGLRATEIKKPWTPSSYNRDKGDYLRRGLKAVRVAAAATSLEMGPYTLEPLSFDRTDGPRLPCSRTILHTGVEQHWYENKDVV